MNKCTLYNQKEYLANNKQNTETQDHDTVSRGALTVDLTDRYGKKEAGKEEWWNGGK